MTDTNGLETTTAITVAEALRLPALQRGLPEVLAGHAQLDRRIRWVHAGEVPHIASLLEGGELLLTTGMGFGGGGAQRRRFVAELAERDVAAVVIELGSVLEEIPDDMREAAERARLPLVVLHREVPFVRVTEAIHTELVSRQYGLLRDGEAIERRLIALMVDGEGLPELLSTLSDIVGNPVFLESASGRLLFHAGASDDLEAWESAPTATGLEQPVPMGPRSRSGRLVVLPTRRRPNELDAIALRHAGGIVALALLRAREEDELAIRERGNLLVELADGRLSGAQAARQAERMGFAPRSGRLLAIAVEESPPSPATARAALLGDVQRELEGRSVPGLWGERARDQPLVALVGVPIGPGAGSNATNAALGESEARAMTARLVADVVEQVWSRRLGAACPTIAVDGPVSWADAGRALRDALQTAACASALEHRQWYDASELELERLLWALRDSGTLEQFVARSLGPLLAHDRDRQQGLVSTLRAFCDHGGHKAEAARALHLHRQALYHRLARIEGLLGVNLSDPARLATLHVALRALPYTAGTDDG